MSTFLQLWFFEFKKIIKLKLISKWILKIK
jgi:hypothetical protein